MVIALFLVSSYCLCFTVLVILTEASTNVRHFEGSDLFECAKCGQLMNEVPRNCPHCKRRIGIITYHDQNNNYPWKQAERKSDSDGKI